MAHIGRRTKCSAERTALVVDAIRTGASNEAAAAIAGITDRTFYRWLEKGESGVEGY